ncbi:MAG: helix-turn-helix domain-containing protein [Spirochaetaceae bacterium]|jgi:two-component system response regulator YesN|nr:helix-turn-helix domain-containing protein [Spirochaetaceae bacterium]
MKTENRTSIYLVDDEQPVLDGLSVTLGKIFPEIRICGTARSGMDAVKGIAREKPDIIIMDVRMPGMSGVDTLREVNKILPGAVSILLTAYERFDIAKDAYALGVYRYLVKPVSQEILAETLTGALRRLEDIKNSTLREASERERFESTRPLLEAGFIWQAVLGDPRSLLLQSFGELLGLVEDGNIRGHFAVICREKYWLTQEEIAAIQRELTNHLVCIPGPLLGGILPVFVPGEKLNRTRDTLRNVLEVLDMRELRYSLGYVASNNDLRLSWSQALTAIQRETENEAVRPPVPGIRDAGTDKVNLMLQQFRDGNTLKLRTAFFEWALAGADKTERAVLAGALCALAGADTEKILAAGKLQTAVTTTGTRETAEYAADLLISALSILPASGEDGSEAYPGSDRRIRRALRFIAAHYSEPISLEDTAAYAELSPAHLSRLFSAETGSTFSSQLARYRITRACKELSEGKLSVKEIAGACGYSDANYFSRAFKKILGLSPTEWMERKQ